MSVTGADLRIDGVEAGYGGSTVLTGVDLHVGAGETVALLGRNGVGKTTLMATVMGFVRALGGTIHLGDEDITHLPTHARARSGVAIVPQGRRVFAPLTVHNNLRIAEGSRSGEWTLERVYELMPRLRERKGNRGDQLSGGEQQMLAIGRALMARPKILMLDEPSLGLAPKLVAQVFATVERVRDAGLTVLLVEQNAAQALRLADHAYVLESGRVVLDGAGLELLQDDRVRSAYLGA